MCRTHATVRSVIGALVGGTRGTAVADMEAGLEHLSRGTPRHADTIVAVLEPYFKSLETGRKISTLAQELGVPRIYAVANKVQSADDEAAVEAFCARHGLTLIGSVPYDPVFLDADRAGRAPLDLAPEAPGVSAIARVARRLEAAA